MWPLILGSRGRGVARADVDLTVGDDRAAERFVAEGGDPFDVLVLAFFDAPVRRDVLIDDVGQVALRRAAEERAIAFGCFLAFSKSDDERRHGPAGHSSNRMVPAC